MRFTNSYNAISFLIHFIWNMLIKLPSAYLLLHWFIFPEVKLSNDAYLQKKRNRIDKYFCPKGTHKIISPIYKCYSCKNWDVQVVTSAAFYWMLANIHPRWTTLDHFCRMHIVNKITWRDDSEISTLSLCGVWEHITCVLIMVYFQQ